MDVIRSVGSSLPSIYLIDLSQSLLQLLALDRFGDFVGDTVIAPVRETAAQALGVLLKYLDREDVAAVHGSLVEMVRQSWAKRRKEAASLSRGEKFSWEVRHAGLLGLKYEVAVRRDLLSEQWKGEEDVKPGMGDQRSTMLQDVVDSAVLA
jgi:TATA-binding protein-associated factor